MTARHEHRAAESIYRDHAPRFRIGQQVRTAHGIGLVEFIANSNAMQSPLYTVAFGPVVKLRLLECALEGA